MVGAHVAQAPVVRVRLLGMDAPKWDDDATETITIPGDIAEAVVGVEIAATLTGEPAPGAFIKFTPNAVTSRTPRSD